MEKFIFIIVNYNGANVSIDCIKSILSLDNSINYVSQIIVVDNNSDNTDKLILKNYESTFNQKSKLNLIFTDNNLGYFGALNKGLSSIKNKDKYYIIIGNNDLIFNKNFCSLVNDTEFKSCDFVISPNIITLDNIHQNPISIKRLNYLRRLSYKIYFLNYSISKLVTKFATLIQRNRTIKNKDGCNLKQYIHTGFGACYILTPFFWGKNNELLNKVFLNGEEPIFSYQIHSTGGKILYTPEIIVKHINHASVIKKSNRWSFETTKKSYRIYKKYL